MAKGWNLEYIKNTYSNSIIRQAIAFKMGKWFKQTLHQTRYVNGQ